MLRRDREERGASQQQRLALARPRAQSVHPSGGDDRERALSLYAEETALRASEAKERTSLESSLRKAAEQKARAEGGAKRRESELRMAAEQKASAEHLAREAAEEAARHTTAPGPRPRNS